jgi:hypothetical protein
LTHYNPTDNGMALLDPNRASHIARWDALFLSSRLVRLLITAEKTEKDLCMEASSKARNSHPSHPARHVPAFFNMDFGGGDGKLAAQSKSILGPPQSWS